MIRPLFRTRPEAMLKADASPVTIADRAAEQAMRAVLHARCPDCGIAGEEFGIDRPDAPWPDAPWRWVLDPIDGTRAFLTGRPIFATLIALLHHDEPVLGVIDQPVTGERWLGVAGEATQFHGPFGGLPATRPCPALAAAELSATSPEMLGPHRPAWDRLAAQVRRVSWGGDAYAYGLLALGQIDLIAEADLKPWDWAALVPVIQGAGGRITNWSGTPLRADGDGRVLAVGDPALLPAAVAALAGG